MIKLHISQTKLENGRWEHFNFKKETEYNFWLVLEQRYIILHLSTDYFFPRYQREKDFLLITILQCLHLVKSRLSSMIAGKQKKERKKRRKKWN